MQRDGANVVLGEYLIHATLLYGPLGDHAPIHHSFYEHERPLFKFIYSDPNVVNRVKIDINNWNDSPSVWTRRFTGGEQGIEHPELLI